MAQRSSPILPITSGIGAVSPVNVGGPGSAEEAFRNEQGLLQRLFSGLGGGGNRAPSLSDISGGYYADQRGAGSAIPSATSPAMSPSELDDFAGLSIAGALGPSSVPTPSEILSSLFRAGPAARPQANVRQPDDLVETIPSPFDDLSGFNIDPRGSVGGTLFGDPVETTPAQAQETAGILTKLIQDSATRGGAETAATDGKESSTTDERQGPTTSDPYAIQDKIGQSTGLGETQTTETQTTESNIYSDLMKTSTNSVLEALGKAPEGAKSIDDYKKIFSDATGIDISGQPDNSAALTAFGLALMQNKAGKGFNVGKILSETGAAGEKALPLMVQAKKDAKASQLAAGQFALTQQSKDAATRTAFITDQVNYLRDRRDKINDDMVARINATEDIRLKAKLKAEGDYQNHLYNRQIKLLELNNKAAKGQFKTGDKTTFKPITGMDNLTLTMGVRESDGQPVFKFPAEEAARFGVALADVNDGLRSLDDMSALISNVANQPGGVTGQKAIEVLNGWSRSLGFDNIYYDPDAKTATPLADADAIKKRVIAQYKRFLSQETGNGISEGDVTRLENALGDVNWFANPDVALQRIEETRAIFMGRKSQLVSEIESFDDRDLYLSEKQYEKTMRGLAGDIDAAYYYDKSGGSGRSAMMSEIFDITEDADGMQTYRLKSS